MGCLKKNYWAVGQFAAANSEPACWLGVLLWCPLPPHRRRAVPDGVFHLAGGGQVLLIPCALPQKTSLSGSRVRGSAPLIAVRVWGLCFRSSGSSFYESVCSMTSWVEEGVALSRSGSVNPLRKGIEGDFNLLGI